MIAEAEGHMGLSTMKLRFERLWESCVKDGPKQLPTLNVRGVVRL